MKRELITPRADWQASVEAIGFDFHTFDAAPYWSEASYWTFSAAEIDVVEEAANQLHRMCMEAVQAAIDDRRLPLFGINGLAAELVTESWRRHDPHLYGRVDLAYDGSGPPKLLEYNADTPTSLFEAAIVQWHWKVARFPAADQFNSLEEGLIERLRQLLNGIPSQDPRRHLHLSCVMPNIEDEGNLKYIEACAIDAGFKTTRIDIADIGWDRNAKAFVDLDEKIIARLFKLYPWEWMVKETFGANLPVAGLQLIEPAWKMVLSNKAILAQLWEMYPHHDYLLAAAFDRESIAPFSPNGVVRKALLGREGANITVYDGDGAVLENQDGAYGAEGFVWQARAPLAAVGAKGTAVLGVWLVGDAARGMGIREADGLITTDMCHFVPHIFS
jgi:glutathionylspermidine synthase